MHPNPFSLEGKHAIISGGGTGIGRGIAQCFIAAGARVTLLGRREGPLQETCEALGDRAHYRPVDLKQLEALPSLIDEIEAAQQIDILVNNAGVHLKKDALDTSDEEFLAVIDIHVRTAFALTKAVVKHMKPRRNGVVLFISSMTAFFGMPKVIAYGTAKAGLTGMMHGWINEHAADQIRFNAIAPGWIETPMLHQALDSDPERKRRIQTRIAMQRFGRPEDIGWTAVYLASDAGQYVSGVLLPVDGGAVPNFYADPWEA